jgi:hypothetical protein
MEPLGFSRVLQYGEWRKQIVKSAMVTSGQVNLETGD